MDSPLLSAEAVAAQLHVTPETLRHWTTEFGAQLSGSAVGAGFFRYTADDMRRLQTIRDLLGQGKSKEEVTSYLAPADTQHDPQADAGQPESAQPSPGAPMIIHPDDGGATASAVMREVLTGFAAGQEAILNSQQANRNLMGVVIQDNFSLKEENARLRERMLKLEQELTEMKRQQAEHRAQLELRLRQIEQKRDWLSRLVGF